MNSAAMDWSELAFGSKKPLKDLKAILIAAPRHISSARFLQLVKEYLPQGNLVLGLSKEDYVAGFEGQPQFLTLKADKKIIDIIDKVNKSPSKHKIYTLSYFQRETKYIFEKGNFKKVLLINGSWKYVFHSREEYYVLANNRIDYEMLSPFASEQEAKEYDVNIWPIMVESTPVISPKGANTEEEMLGLVANMAKFSFDYSYQCGVALGRQTTRGYRYLGSTFNKVVPYQTYALHYGASREKNFSPPNDLNHYDAVHAEVMMILKAQKEGLDLHGTTLFINLLPCPSCARMIGQSDIAEIVYTEDHSAGYALQMLELCGKKVRRVVPAANHKL